MLSKLALESELDYILQAMEAVDYVAIDTETSGKDIRDGRDFCMGLSVAFKIPGLSIEETYFPFRHETSNCSRQTLERVRYTISEKVKCIIFHNAKFDLVSLETLGIRYRGEFYDTMLMAHLLNENIPSKELDWLSKQFLDDTKDDSVVKGWAKAFGWEHIPPEVMAEYAAHDANLTFRLYERFQKAWEKHGYDKPNPIFVG